MSSNAQNREFPRNRLIVLWTNKDGTQKWRDYNVSDEEMTAFWNAWKQIRLRKQ